MATTRELLPTSKPTVAPLPVSSAQDPVPQPDLPAGAPAAGSDALANAGQASRELMPSVGAQTLDRPGFEAPTTEKPTAVTTTVGDDETVSGQLRKLLDEGSPYLEQGRQRALTHMSQRGLQNSSLATQAGEQALIATALPIAQQDADTHARRAELNQNTENQFRLNELDHVQGMIERAQQGDINAQLQMDQYGFNSALSAQENIQAMERMALSGDIEAQQRFLAFSYDTIMASIQQGYALQLNDQQFQQAQRILGLEFANASGLSAQDSDERIRELNAAHTNTLEEIQARADAATTERESQLRLQLQAQYLSEVAARQQAASEEIRLIYQTEGLNASQQQQAVLAAQNRMDADIRALQAYYARSPQWDDDFGASPVGGVPGTPTIPASPPLPGTPVSPSGQPALPRPDNRIPGDYDGYGSDGQLYNER